MTLRGVLPATLVAISLVSAPVAASAAPAPPARSGAAIGDSEQLDGHPIAWGMAALIAIVTGILIFTDDDEDEPVSP